MLLVAVVQRSFGGHGRVIERSAVMFRKIAVCVYLLLVSDASELKNLSASVPPEEEAEEAAEEEEEEEEGG